WGQRRAPGEIQKALSDLLQSEARLRQAQLNYKNLIENIDDQVDLLAAQHNLRSDTVRVKRAARNDAIALAATIAVAKTAQRGIEFYIDASEGLTDATVEGLPKVVGLASDATAPARASIKFAHASVRAGWKVAASVLEGAIEAQFAAIDGINDQAALEIDTANYQYEVAQ